eukprot:6181644-Pleurochrysis_carterae.AAC.1
MNFQGSSRTRWSRNPPLATSLMTLPDSTMRLTLPATTSSSLPTTWRTTFSTSAWRRPRTGSPLLLSGDKGFSHGDKLEAFVAEYVLGFGLLCASNYAQPLSIILLALLRCEFRHSVGKKNHATLAWLHARRLHLGADEERMHTALMYTDDIVLAAVGTDRIVALLRAWRK